MPVDFHIITLRPSDGSLGLGRQKTLRGLLDGLPDIGCRPNWLTIGRPSNAVLGFVSGVLRWLKIAAGGRVLPLQSVLALQGRLPRIPAGSEDAEPEPSPVVYLDGVRIAHLIPGLRKRFFGRIIVDFDDLMSRRVARMQRQREHLSFGAFSARVPIALQRLAQKLGPTLLTFEKRLLRRAEIEAARSADAVAFTSRFEAKLFQRFLRRHAPRVSPHYLILGPSTGEMPEADTEPAPDLRFVFIGSDVLEQNRIAIQGIVELDRAGALALNAYVYGKQNHAYAPSRNVVFCGYAESLASVYMSGSILLIPRSVRGGIKSKILEAFEHGIPTIATKAALEGFDGDYPWRVDRESLHKLVSDKAELRSAYGKAVAAGFAICDSQFSSQRYWKILKDYSWAGV